MKRILSAFFYRFLLLALLVITGATAWGQSFSAPHELHVEITDTIDNDVYIHWSFENIGGQTLLGFNLYRNNEKINANPLSSLNYNDIQLEDGTYTYEAEAIYNSGVSGKSNRGIVTIRPGYYFSMGSGDPLENTWSVYIDEGFLGEKLLSPGDEIAVFDADTIAGRLKLLSEPYAENEVMELVAFSSFADTNGYNPGNPYTFKLYDASNDTVYDESALDFDQSSSDFYAGNVFPPGNDELSVVEIIFSLGLPMPINLSAENDGHDIILNWDLEAEQRDLIGYNVFRDDVQLNESPVTATTYTNSDVLSGNYTYEVIARYDEGSSLPSEAVEITLGTVFFEPLFQDNQQSPMELTIYDTDFIGDMLSTFDEVGVFRYTDSDSACYGAVSLHGTAGEYPLTIMVGEDDPDSAPTEGFSEGDNMHFRFYKYAEEKEYIDVLVLPETGQGSFSETFISGGESHLSLSWIPYGPSDLEATVNGYSVTLSWEENSENPPLQLIGYDIYQDGIKINAQPVTEHSYTIPNLLVDSYSYYVKAIYQEMESQPSAQISADIPMHFFTPVSQDTTVGIMTFFITEAHVDEEILDAFDEIGIFTMDDEGNEICVGSVSLHESTDIDHPVKVVAFKDKTTTPEKDGFAEGDSIRYKFGMPGANDFVYNTITYTFPYDASEDYNFEEFSTTDTCFVNLAFNTPPPVQFFFQTADYCLDTSEEIFITAQDFNGIDTLELEIMLDTALYEFEGATPLQPFLNGMETGWSGNLLSTSWSDENGHSISDNDTLMSLTVNTKNDGETGIWWSSNSYSTGLEYQESQFNDHSFYIESIPAHPGTVFGDDEVCTGTAFSNYHVISQSNAQEYLWELSDAEAGNLSPSGNEVMVIWNNNYEGETDLKLTTSNFCGTSLEAEKAIDVTTSVVVGINISNTIEGECEGDTIQFVAEGINGGNNPTYDWYINGALQSNHSTILQRTDFSDGDEIYCMLYSSSQCAENSPVQSETVEMDLNPLPQRPESITGPDIICSTVAISEYTTPGAFYANGYVWQLAESTMGTIESYGNNATIHWNPETHGAAHISVRGSNACGVGPARQFITIRTYCTDIEANTAKAPEIFPNPFKEGVTIEVEALNPKARAVVTDLRGIQLHAEKMTGPTHHLSLHHLSQGMYVLKIFNGSEVFFYRIIKE